MILRNRVYNALKFVALVLLPGFSTAYFGLAQVWGLPNVDKVVGTIAIIDTALGGLLKLSTSSYNKTTVTPTEPDGDLVIGEVDGQLHPALAGTADGLARMAGKSQVTLNVVIKRPETLEDADLA